MIYGRYQREGELIVHTIFTVGEDQEEAITDLAFRSNELLKASAVLNCPPKHIRALAQSTYSSYMHTTPTVTGYDHPDTGDEEKDKDLIKTRTEDMLPVAARDLDVIRDNYSLTLDSYKKQLKVYASAREQTLVTPTEKQELIAIGYKAVVLKRYLSYIEATLVHTSRTVLSWTAPVEMIEEGKKCQVSVNREKLDPDIFLQELEKELELQSL